MKKKAGIFDPWRQDAQPNIAAAAPKKVVTGDPVAGTSTADNICVQFAGLRAGINVWVVTKDPADDGSATARQRLISVLHRLTSREGVTSILRGWGIYPGSQGTAEEVVISDGTRKIFIVVPTGDNRSAQRAIDNLSLALREISQQFPDVSDMLRALDVSPYVK